MKIIVLFYIDRGVTDRELDFKGDYLPEVLGKGLGNVPRIDDVCYSLPAGYKGRLSENPKAVMRSGDADAGFWKELFTLTGADHVIKVFADSPFLEPALIEEMTGVHLEYLSEFTYSENLPEGLSCEIYSRELLDQLPETKDATLPLGQVIRSNINRFDVELFYKDPDIRDKRISFRSSSPRDKRIMENIHALHGHIPVYGEIAEVIGKDPGVLFTGPSYLELELTGKCGLDCIFCYRKTLKQEHGEMDPSLAVRIAGEMRSFNLPYSVCFGGSGEPLMHPRFYEILDTFRAESLVENIIIETNGILADANYAGYISRNADQRIKTIFNISGLDGETYRTLHGFDGFDLVSGNISILCEALQGSGSIYVQLMKINETEPFTDRYYDFWEGRKVPIIFQKQNTYLGRMQDRRYSDLSPLERGPCWHLQRDLYILSDGKVAFCKQDVDAESAAGDLDREPLAAIWEKKRQSFLDEYRKKYCARPDCRSCDEWYTFNF